ncbi:MAG: dimethyl sulfoxide reductase anchor subunit [Burkholderiales bacterium]|nr:dimethyl sulfoxide reductase anchor subunit [Burkholderiales bacterium]
MRPAFSVILFTVLAGMGQGLFLMLVRADALGADPHELAVGGFASVALLGAGLACSFFHLGHPMRAWRAIAMWRTSWLSREVIVLPLTIAVVALWSLEHLLGKPHTAALAAAGVVLCLALWWCTGMIYACLRFLREWAHPLTLLNFALLGWMSGATLFAAYWSVLHGAAAARLWVVAAMVLTCAGAAARLASLARNRALRPKSTPQSAIGVAAARVRQISQGTTGGSFNTREFFHGRSAAFVANVKSIALVLAFALPLVLLAAAWVWPVPGLLPAAAAAQFVGLIAERWLFFAQANHPQNIYYQAVA